MLVHTQPAQQGSLPEIVTAYGSAMPAPRGMMTLSLQQQGQVSSVDVTVGQSVRQNETLIDFTASAAERSTYDQAVAALSLANDQRTHALQLMAQHLATRDQLAQADKAVADARAALDALRREGAGEATRTITAPFDGVVSAIPVTQGQRVAAGAPLVTVTRQDGLVVTVGVEPGIAPSCRSGALALRRSPAVSRCRARSPDRRERRAYPEDRYRYCRLARRRAGRRGVSRRHHRRPIRRLGDAARCGADR